MFHHHVTRPFLILAFVLLSLAMPVQAQDSDKLPALSLEEIVSLKHVTKVKLSPDGDTIAYLLSVPRALYEDEDGPAWKQLHVVNTEGDSRPYFSGQVEVSDMAWSADGRSLYFVAKRDVSADYADIFSIPVDGGEAAVIYKGESGIKAIYPAPSGASIAFLAKDPKPEKEDALKDKGFKALVYEESVQPTRVWLLDLESGEALAQDLKGSASAFAWAPASGLYAVALAPTPLIDDEYMERDIFVVNAHDAVVQAQLGVSGKMGSFTWSPDGSQIAWIGAQDLHDPSPGRLYVSSSRGGERVDLVPGYNGHVKDFRWLDEDSLEWMGNRGLWSETGKTSTRRPRPAGEPPGSGPYIRQLDAWPDQRVAAAIAEMPQHPAEVYLLKSGSAPQRLTHSNPVLEERRLARQEVISYKARDGLELEAVLVHPMSAPTGQGSPLVMMIHGGPEGHYSNGWMSAYSRPAQSLAAQGYLVVYPNYRGSTGRGVEFSMMGQHGYAGAEFDDIVDAKQHLVKAGLADGDRTGITGGSYGGYASMWAASALSEHFAAAVAFVGISDQISKFGTTDIPKEMYNVHARSWPWEDWMWMLQRSPIYYADQVKTPLLIMHGAKDPRVHPSQSLEMYRHVKVRTQTPVRLVYYPGEGHGNKNTAAQYDFALRLDRWMNHFLTGAGGEAPPYEIDHAARLKD